MYLYVNFWSLGKYVIHIRYYSPHLSINLSHVFVTAICYPQTKLADKQAAVEKLQWEAAASNKKVEKLQEDLEMVQGDLSSMMLLIQGLTKSDALSAEDYEDVSYPLDEFDIVSNWSLKDSLSLPFPMK